MISKVCANITPSATVSLSDKVNDLRGAGAEIVSLNIGEPDFPTPAFICEACKRAIDDGKTRYINVNGLPQLRRAICRKLEAENHAVYLPDQICVSTGAKQALNNAVTAAVTPGQEVLVPVPCWVSYLEIVKLHGGIPVPVPTRPDFQLDLEAIEAAVTEKTAAVIVNSPNNPTGAVYTRSSLERLAELAEKHDFWILSDEIYERLIYNGAKNSCVAALSPEAYAHSILINGFSKAYAMTGWRLGYTAAPAEAAKGIRAIQGHTTSNSTSFVQWAAIEALTKGEASIRRMVGEFEKRRRYAFSRLSAMDGIECTEADGAFYFLPKIRAYFGAEYDGGVIGDSFDFCNYILENAHVAIVPGAAFLSPDTVRIAYTNSMDQIALGLDRMEAALKRLKRRA